LNAFLRNIHDGVYETDVHGNFIYFNKALCRILGFPVEEIHGQNFSHFMDKENARKVYDAFTKVWVIHKGFSDIIWQVIDKTGNKRIIELSANLIKNEKGEKQGFQGIARDVTERFRAQEALKDSELRYQRAYETSRRSERWAKKLLDFVPYAPYMCFSQC
jgi:PAS domain S-box-containing protein